MKSLYFFIAFIILLSGNYTPGKTIEPSIYQGYQPREGDILFQKLPDGKLANAINGVTKSDYTHCGMVIKDTNGKWMVVEAYNRVIKVTLKSWIERGVNKGFAVCRLKECFNSIIPALVDSAKAMLRLPYDYKFSFDDEHIYCSELIYKAFMRVTGDTLGETQKLETLNWQAYEDFIRRTQKGELPLDHELITPLAIAQAEQLTCIYERSLNKNNDN